ncbi:aminotransferase class III-fold pyridoxal phosphate-dependent enzyme [Pseudomonas sp. S 311-6]|uniref:aspartate aminotransferase family protein n=1 Tax=Pseudomonas TaxID=286 RepID=UPI0020973F1C|nr:MULTISPECIES: aminotransferase class III-fold pyridoxal phosphate-dependent enzyme [Pseudomonas]MCO7565599.1 aminotransferase class III-fold pyridoxal phosphate-dependent enzyme [Pseudomonas mosselii]MCO7617707.1 aminotransferase class III-fold pyridoxal phosphate-dependent enzyme [Pseudomonas guariconensis]MCO7640209.1 aminotransferase class III-fold pyridoxal phosphate-dependent enzyme [Pseudomonas sp. S 311-6]
MRNLVGDVSSAARILPELNGQTLFIRKGKGAYLWDDQGRRYIDTALGFGAVLLGHANDQVTAQVAAALADSPSPSWAHVREHAAATALAAHTGALSKVIFTNSGSEAVHLACRAARAFTGRGRIAKMAAGFDGWFDDVSFGNVSSREAGFADGQRPATSRTTLLRFNDFDDVERLFAEDPDIAAVILEPMLANAGCIMPAPGYLAHVQDVAHRHGALVISDEVLMGFRLHAGLAALHAGLDPDIASVGKAIGNGVPVSAIVGKPHILAGFEEGRVLRGGTFSGNPMACAAVMSTLAQLDDADYPRLLERGEGLRLAVEEIFAAQGMAVSTSGYGNVFGIWPSRQAPATYAQALEVGDAGFSKALHLALREAGLLMMPSQYGRIYLSFDHSDEVVDDMKACFEAAAASLAPRFAHAG